MRVSDRFRDNLRLSVTERIRVRIQTVPGLRAVLGCVLRAGFVLGCER